MPDKQIKSFEVSENANVGDILSEEKKNKTAKLRAGLICGGWFEWWTMFSHTDLERKIRKDAEKVVKNLKKVIRDKYELVYPGMVDTLGNAYDIGEEFKKKNVDVVIIVENTYLTDFIILEILDHLQQNVPIIIFSTQATKDLAPDMDNIEIVRYEGLVGMTQLIGAFKKMGYKYKAIAGSGDDFESYQRIEKHLQVLSLKKSLKKMDFGILGHTFRGMYDIEIDKTKLKGAVGPNILYIDTSHFINIWKKITEKEVTKYQREIEKEIPIKKYKITDEDIKKSLGVGIALKKLVLRFNLDGITILGQHHLEIASRASTDFSHHTVEKMGCMHTCEGDMGNLTMKKILYLLSNSLPVFLEWTAFNESSNTLLLTHHGVVDPILASDIKKCRWTPSPEKWDFTGNGLSIEYCAKAGEVTLASLIDEKDGWKILISEGECVEMEPKPCFAPQFYFKPKMRVTEYIEKIMQEGVSHHVCLVYGNYVEQMELLADYLNIKKVYV